MSHLIPALALSIVIGSSLAGAERAVGAPAELPLIDFSSHDAARQVAPTKGVSAAIVTVDKTGISMGFPIQPAPHSGVHVTPATGKTWDLSAYGHVEAKVTNTGVKILPFVMHVVNDVEGYWQEVNTEAIDIPPGETKVLTVYFGYQYGFEPSASFKASSVTEIYMFLYDTDQPHSFCIEELKAGGFPGEKPVLDPSRLSYQPPHGVILGPGATFDAATQVETAGAQVSPGLDGAVAVKFSGGLEESLKIKPRVGAWDLSDANEIRVKLKNTGQVALTPAVQIGSTRISTQTPLAPGAETEISVPFAVAPSVNGAKPILFESDRANEIDIISDSTPSAKSLLITSILADTITDKLPDWLGKKPPVDGDWSQTFDEKFNGSPLDLSRWNIYGQNRIPASRGWNHNHNANRLTHFSKDDVIVGDGKVRLHYEKKTGIQNDAAKGQQTDYSSGYLSCFGKWTQRYGYFESRLRLPDAPGLWSAFTLIPDRGKATSPVLNRSSGGKLATDVGAGGCEFDLVNFLSRWGVHRISVGARENLHGDKVLASQNIYLHADQEGYITAGLLWTPGVAVFYINGKEMFRWENARVSDVESCIRFDMVVGGYDNNHVDDTKLPADFSIDYVRVWQRKDLASPEDGPQPNAGDPDEAKN